MQRTVLGVFALLFGLLVVAACGFGLNRADEMVTLAAAADADPAVWAEHWRNSLTTYLLLGLVAMTGGVLILRRAALGALVVAAAALAAAAIPWIALAFGYSQFEFEKPNVVETALLVSLAGFMLAMFINRARWLV
jgi:hypothetical protein